MTHDEARQLKDAGRRIRELETRVAAQARLLMILLQRKSGRPTRAEADEVETLAERICG